MTSETLKVAIAEHEKGNNDHALKLYLDLINSNFNSKAPYLNAAAILREQSRQEDSIKILKKGIKLFPGGAGLFNNLGNSLADLGNDLEAIVAYRKALKINHLYSDSRHALIKLLLKKGFPHLAYATSISGIKLEGRNDKYIVAIIESLYAFPSDELDNQSDFKSVIEKAESALYTVYANDPPKIYALLMQVLISLGRYDEALKARENLVETINEMSNNNKNIRIKRAFQKTWHNLSWNLSICLLKEGKFKNGWELYDHGLQVPCKGVQRWQRSLKKPFKPSEVKIWRGENLKNKRLILLGEQGIGDTMMFATLIPTLIDEGALISLFPGDRLVDIYRRSLPNINVIRSSELSEKQYTKEDFDFQTPIGSVCQYRFTTFEDYSPRKNILISDAAKTSELSTRYRKNKRPLIGISWQGGGKANVIKDKSIGLNELYMILKRDDLDFISLQYGDDAPHLERFNLKKSTKIMHDDEINPLKDMDTWLSQVNAVDGVLSIANTTIHGAGGLGKPTFCLVSKKSDWRWIKPDLYHGNYWYQSVETAYQDDDGSWQGALQSANEWLNRTFIKPNA